MKKIFFFLVMAVAVIASSCTKVEPTTLKGQTNCSVQVNVTSNFTPGAILTLKYSVGSESPAVQTVIMPSQTMTIPLHCPPASVLKVSASCGAGEYAGSCAQKSVIPGQQVKLEINMTK